MKTAKFTIVRHTTYKINENYSQGCRGGPSKLTKITKFMKTAKFAIIRHTTNEIKEIYSKGCREGPLKVTTIARITKFTKTAKFTEISKTIDKMQWNLTKLRYLREFASPSKKLKKIIQRSRWKSLIKITKLWYLGQFAKAWIIYLMYLLIGLNSEWKWRMIVAVGSKFSNLTGKKKAEKIRASMGFEPVISAILVLFSTNWAMKPHIGSEVNLLSSYLPWGVKMMWSIY